MNYILETQSLYICLRDNQYTWIIYIPIDVSGFPSIVIGSFRKNENFNNINNIHENIISLTLLLNEI